MKVLVDTSVWSLALRRSTKAPPTGIIPELSQLIANGQAFIIGAVRQEILSGIKNDTQFRLLRERLRAFSDVPILTADHENAAELCNRCRSVGIQGSSIDFLICAVAIRHDFAVFTTDKDFARFAKVIEVKLHQPAP